MKRLFNIKSWFDSEDPLSPIMEEGATGLQSPTSDNVKSRGSVKSPSSDESLARYLSPTEFLKSSSPEAHVNELEEMVLTGPEAVIPSFQPFSQSLSSGQGNEKKDFLMPYTINIQKQLLNLGSTIENIRTPLPQHVHLHETHILQSLSMLKEHVSSRADIDSVTMNIIYLLQEYAHEKQLLNTTLFPDLKAILNDLELRNQNMNSKIASVDVLLGKTT